LDEQETKPMIRNKDLPTLKAGTEWETFKDDVTRLREDVSGLAEALIRAGREEAGQARDKLEEEARHRLNQLRGTADDARSLGRSAFESLEGRIKERPLTSALVALAAGIVLGRIMRLR
jgi:ElaB/YqjD/DUF883 family membrane-anchored ribosome-binding protein